MEQEENLKEILLMSSETASVDFTERVMKRVNKLSTTTFYYEPLISNKIQKVFVFFYFLLVSFIFILCLIVGFAKLPLSSWIENLSLSAYTHSKILSFICIFWIVFTANALIE